MDAPRKVVLYGSSLFVAGVEACLCGQPGLVVTRIDPTLPDDIRRLPALRPDAIIFDYGDADVAAPPGIAQLLRDIPDVLVIGLDLSSQAVTLLSGHQQVVTRVEDVADAIRMRAGGGSYPPTDGAPLHRR
jgi:hypothetical protein